MAASIKMSLGIELSLGPGDFMLDWDPASPSPKGAQTPQFSAHIRCGPMFAWIKMSLGMELGLDQCNFVLDGDLVAASPRGVDLQSFDPCLL